jgi:hypothetical protein
MTSPSSPSARQVEPKPRAAAAPGSSAAPSPAPAASEMETVETTPSEEVVRLRAKVEHARTKKKEYRQRQRVRQAEAKAAAVAAAAATSNAPRVDMTSAAAAPAPAPSPSAFTFGRAPAATTAGASVASTSVPAAPAPSLSRWAPMGPGGCAVARPAARTAGTPPGLLPTSPAAGIFGAAAGISSPRVAGAGQGPPVFVAAYGGHMPHTVAYARLVEDVTSTCSARGSTVPRTCLFPRGPRQQVMVLGSSRAARMSERDLGAYLASWLLHRRRAHS